MFKGWLIDLVNFERPGALLFDQPRRQRALQSEIGTRLGNKPLHLILLRKSVQCVWIRGRKHEVVVAEQRMKPRKLNEAAIEITLDQHGALRDRTVAVRAGTAFR